MSETKERPDTPCVAVCSTTFDEICRGCGRTVTEVADWVFMNAEQKKSSGNVFCRKDIHEGIAETATEANLLILDHS
jgi:predicted Fe-S protein YdhL (DUF1289 family)